jgi:serine/threonine protein kinase
LYEVGNFLGGGAAGTVYEAENVKTKEHFALKILNPLGYKLISPSLLRRCTVISKGKPVPENVEKNKESLGIENIWWMFNRSTKQHIASYYSERQSTLLELSLSQCISIWGTNPPELDKYDSSDDRAVKPVLENTPPRLPQKYVDFVMRRARIFREIYNMRKISNHVNVIRLENVLELLQESKCTLFLVMELANGGELFDRIKIDCGTREDTAKRFFRQLLSGVCHCHEEGVCHRDLKPENLLLQDLSDGTSILKVLIVME